jgi:hypothetical protein
VVAFCILEGHSALHRVVDDVSQLLRGGLRVQRRSKLTIKLTEQVAWGGLMRGKNIPDLAPGFGPNAYEFAAHKYNFPRKARC